MSSASVQSNVTAEVIILVVSSTFRAQTGMLSEKVSEGLDFRRFISNFVALLYILGY